MSNWYTVATPLEVDRLRAAWPGAPTENVELCATLLDVAREQVEAFAPAAEPEVAVPFPTPLTVVVNSDGVSGTIRFSREPGDVLRLSVDLGNSGPDIEGWWGQTVVPSDATAFLVDYQAANNYGGQGWAYLPGGTFGHTGGTWASGTGFAFDLLANPAVSDPEPAPVVPSRYSYAQLQQAMNLWAAGRADENGNVGTEGYSFQPRPLDKTIRNIIRPTSGVPRVL